MEKILRGKGIRGYGKDINKSVAIMYIPNGEKKKVAMEGAAAGTALNRSISAETGEMGIIHTSSLT